MATSAPFPTLPILLWFVLQFTALALAGFRVPLSARFFTPAEELAAIQVVIVQTIAGAMLFPLLFRNLLSTLITLGSAILLYQFAAFLSAEADNFRLVAAEALVCLWLLCLAAWGTILKSPRSQMVGVAIAVFLSAGGALLAYLYREFGLPPSENFAGAKVGWLGPTTASITFLCAGIKAGTVWYFLGSTLVITAFGVPIARRAVKTRPESGTDPHTPGPIHHEPPRP